MIQLRLGMLPGGFIIRQMPIIPSMQTAWAAAMLVIVLSLTTGAAAQPAPSADLQTRDVHTNFMESFSVTVQNPGPEDMIVVRVSVTIDWPGWAPTLYPVFEGREVVPAGEGVVFTGDPIRMPQTDAGSYPAFVAVVTESAAGQQEHRSQSSVNISDWSIEPGGAPEFIAIPIALASVMLLITLALFRLERSEGWPPLRAVPRFHQKRRT